MANHQPVNLKKNLRLAKIFKKGLFSPFPGRCVCEKGFSGPRCDRPCPKGHYGMGCKQACPPCTSGYGTCDYLTGQCECEPGFTGFFCMEPCPEGTYGRR